VSDGVIILGAGLAGLSAAHHLGLPYEVFEKSPHKGGHCHSKQVKGFLFDEGAHVFFGQGECAETFIKRPLDGHLVEFTADIWNHYDERRFGRYPVQANAHALPAELATRCVLDFVQASQQPEREVRNYEDWCLASFGETFARTFMLHYARKVWTVEPADLNVEWLGSKVGGRISRPSLEQVLRGAIDASPQTLNYLTCFSYPDQGGFARVVAPLADKVAPVHLGRGLARLESRARRMTFSDGSSRDYAVAISTMPLPALVRVTADAPDDVRAAAHRLRWTSVRCVNLGVNRTDLGPGHWVYFYDHGIPFFRVSFPSKFASANAPAGCGSISCEIAYSATKPLEEAGLVDKVVSALRQTGILVPTDEIVLTDQTDIPYAYVIFDHHRAESLRTIHTWMESVGVYPCGRFGEWGYHWSFEAIESGQRVARQVTEHLSAAN
jgi:protoporphyrinogen oxidase